MTETERIKSNCMKDISENRMNYGDINVCSLRGFTSFVT